jgi:putative nucleotidyltransferase with HDIG domain
MRKILFVDDDPKEIKWLKKMLESMCHEWEMEFAASGEEALTFMAKSPFDAVVSDMRMPEMNGVELLGIITERYPETVCIIHSELSDKETVLRSVKSTYQFLMKPSNAETLKYTVERVCKLQDLLRSETLRNMIAGIRRLPTLPQLYNLIVAEMQSKEPSLKKVGHIISQDVSMSAKILQLVNSNFYGLPLKIADPQQAAVYLGVDTLKSLVLSIDVFSSFTEDAELRGFSLAEMWKHSLMTGRLARDIARAVTSDGKAAEEAMIAGILHDIGKLILLKAPMQYEKVEDFIEKSGCSRVEAEYAVMKTSHAELGAYLLGLWGIPDNVVEAVAFHHNPSKLLEDIFVTQGKSSNKGIELETVKKQLTGFAIVTAVHVANALMMQEVSSSSATTFPYIDIRYLGKLNVTDKLPKWAERCNKIRQEDV